MIASAMAVYGKVNESSRSTASKLVTGGSQDSTGAANKNKELESRHGEAGNNTSSVQDEINKVMDQRLKK